MLDPKLLRQHLEETSAQLARRNYALDITTFQQLETERKQLQITTEQQQHEQNKRSKELGQCKARGEDVELLHHELGKLSAALKTNTRRLADLQQQIHALSITIPNLPHASVPAGSTAEDNLVLRSVGKIQDFDFPPKDHVDLGQQLGLLDFATATTISAARFVVMRGMVARLHRALIQFMLDTHINEHNYTEVNMPYLVCADSLLGTGQLPKFADELFYIPSHELYLIPTAEVPITNLLREQTLNTSAPQKYVCHSPCFRSEAGSYGKDTRGMIRQHQFEKVELVQFVHPDDSYAALENLTAEAETILQRLELPYQVVALCGGDLGFSAAKTYDIEVWLPGQAKYREISSCSNFEAFQTRRIKARFRCADTKQTQFFHTLNGSGLAVGRTLIAIMENHQDANGNIHIPAALRSYMGGMDKICIEDSH